MASRPQTIQIPSRRPPSGRTTRSRDGATPAPAGDDRGIAERKTWAERANQRRPTTALLQTTTSLNLHRARFVKGIEPVAADLNNLAFRRRRNVVSSRVQSTPLVRL